MAVRRIFPYCIPEKMLLRSCLPVFSPNTSSSSGSPPNANGWNFTPADEDDFYHSHVQTRPQLKRSRSYLQAKRMRRLSRNGSQSSAERDPNSPKSPQKKRLHADESPQTERVTAPLAEKLDEELQNDKTSQSEPKNLAIQGSHSGPNSSCSCSDSCHASVSCSSSDDDNHMDVTRPSSTIHSLTGSTKQITDDKMRNSIEDSNDFLINSCGSHRTSSRHSSIDENSDLEPHFIPSMINDNFNLSEAESEVRKMIRQCSQVSVTDGCCYKVSASFEGAKT